MNATAAEDRTRLAAYYVVLVDGDSDGTEFAYWGSANRAQAYYARRGHQTEIRPVFDSREAEYAYYARPAWSDSDLFTELDGLTFPSLKELREYHDYLSEAEAEGAWLRAAENNAQYAWEDEQDRLRAAWGL